MDDHCLCLHLCLCLSPPPILLCLRSLTFFMYILSPLNTMKMKVRKGQQCLTVKHVFQSTVFPNVCSMDNTHVCLTISEEFWKSFEVSALSYL